MHDPRHWARKIPGEAPFKTVSYKARAVYDYRGFDEDELSFHQNELLLVFSHLGNGWLRARRLQHDTTSGQDSPRASGENMHRDGRVPENYLEKC